MEIRLDQNYPNPFNPDTRIKFHLQQRGIVKLVVYDLLGREVRRLVEEEKEPGEYVVVWDGRYGQGESASSGTYFYRLESYPKVHGLRVTQTRRMILLR